MTVVTINHSPRLLKDYLALPLPLRSIVQLKALIPGSLTQTDMLRCASVCGIKRADGKAITGPDLQAMQRFLETEGFLDKQGCCVGAIAHPIAVDTVQHNSRLVSGLKEALIEPSLNHTYWYEEDKLLRAAYFALHVRDASLLERVLKNAKRSRDYSDLWVGEVFNGIEVSIEWLKTQTPLVQKAIVVVKMSLAWRGFYPTPELDAMARHYAFSNEIPEARYYSLTHLILTGHLQKAEEALQALMHFGYGDCLVKGTLFFLSGQHQNALSIYQTALDLFKKETKKRNYFFTDLHGVCFLLSEMVNKQDLYQIVKQLELAARSSGNEIVFHAIKGLMAWMLGNEQEARRAFNSTWIYDRPDPLSVPIWALAKHLVGGTWTPEDHKNFPDIFKKLEFSYPLLGAWLAEILILKTESVSAKKKYQIYLDNQVQTFRFLTAFNFGEPWERKLDLLERLLVKEEEHKPIAEDRRMVLWIDPKKYNFKIGEQKRKKNGDFSSGNEVSFSRIIKEDKKLLDCATEQDLQILRATRKAYQEHGGYYPAFKEMFLAMIGHPHIYDMQSPDLRLEFQKGHPELLVQQKGEDFLLKLSCEKESAGVILFAQTPTRYQVIDFTEEFVKIFQVLGKSGLTVPASAKEKMVSVIRRLSPHLVVQSDLDVLDIPAVEGISTPSLHLVPYGQGLKLNLWVRPFGLEGPYYRAGQGTQSVVALVAAGRQRAIRDFKQEKLEAEKLLTACPALQEGEAEVEGEWLIEEPEVCLETLSQLEDYRKHASIHMEWPEGQKLAVTSPLATAQLSLKIRREQDWFSLEGKVLVDAGEVIQIQKLLELMDGTTGRFVRLEEGKFLALTEHFAKQLRLLKQVSESHHKHQRIHRLAATSLEEILHTAGAVDADEAWATQLDKIKNAKSHTPVIPSTLQAELRTYQQTGFAWLSRLAHWGVGACLADDMGLGKTLQALAVLLERAGGGAALVVAPTSVCHNWMAEAARFAPTLTLKMLGNNSRSALIESLGSRDVLVTSYSLLQQEGEAMIAKTWHTVVLDEAQAIKNATTLRSQTAMQLSGDFKMVLTGTPIENHLGELWNLFRFINPGLLGSWESFQKRFLIPIERDKAAPAKQALKKLVQPFILRRLKSVVLEELPPITEQTILIAPEPSEIAFYEALRQKALESLENLSDQPIAHRRLHILAEITRLRRACCHPKLVYPDAPVESHKLKTFTRLVQDLLENNHKALVFSQFVGYLAYAKQVLDELGIRHQYLDGSVPMQARKTRVEAFQSGEGDVFLISLKAGGSGLNLTAADYVIHLDPWWNPAVEDQASHRAHRIGQVRPVTVYRLIMQNTIEEKMIALHRNKRDLADDLLGESDISGKLNEAALLELLRG